MLDSPCIGLRSDYGILRFYIQPHSPVRAIISLIMRMILRLRMLVSTREPCIVKFIQIGASHTNSLEAKQNQGKFEIASVSLSPDGTAQHSASRLQRERTATLDNGTQPPTTCSCQSRPRLGMNYNNVRTMNGRTPPRKSPHTGIRKQFIGQ